MALEDVWQLCCVCWQQLRGTSGHIGLALEKPMHGVRSAHGFEPRVSVRVLKMKLLHAGL